MKNSMIVFCAAGLLMIASSCSPVKITSSWREPNKQVTVAALNKVLVVAAFKTEVNSRKAEDQMVAYLSGKGVVAYSYFATSGRQMEEEDIRRKIKQDGFDGAVTMRLVDVDKAVTYMPGRMGSYPAYYGSFTGYYYQNWVRAPYVGEYASIKTYTVEINVYSIKEDKIIWTGLTETVDPRGVQKMTEQIAKVVYHKMVKEGFVIAR